MNRTAVDSPLENEHGSALWILGIFLDDDRRANAREEFIHRESVVSERVVDVTSPAVIRAANCCQRRDTMHSPEF